MFIVGHARAESTPPVFFSAGPQYADGKLYAGLSNGELLVLDPKQGRELTRVSVCGGYLGRVWIAGKKLYLHCFEGLEVWDREALKRLERYPIYLGQSEVLAIPQGGILDFSLDTIARRSSEGQRADWQVDAPEFPLWTSFDQACSRRAAFLALERGTSQQVDIETGRLNPWDISRALATDVGPCLVVERGAMARLGGSAEGLIWRRQISGFPLIAPQERGGHVVVLAVTDTEVGGYTLYVLRRSDGSLRWRVRSPYKRPIGALSLRSRSILVRTLEEDGHVDRAYDLVTGLVRWSYEDSRTYIDPFGKLAVLDSGLDGVHFRFRRQMLSAHSEITGENLWTYRYGAGHGVEAPRRPK